jgi:hypothetical protein
MINYIKSLGGLKEEPLNELSPELKQSFWFSFWWS